MILFQRDWHQKLKNASLYEPKKFGNIKKMHEKLLIPQNCGEICYP